MARFYGVIGFIKTVERDPENRPGIWDAVTTERAYSGEVYSRNARWNQNGNINDDLVIDHRISVIADTFLKENIGAMKYVRWNGIDWKITNIELQHPRLILTIGGEYHKPEDKPAPQVRSTSW